MHFLFGILGLLAAIGGIIWRIQMASEAARHIGDAAKTAANLPRKLSFRRKTGKSGSQLVQDPREAAVILMLEVARAAGEVSREQKDMIRSIVSEHFEFSEADADEIVTQAAWVSQSEAGQDALIRRMVKIISAAVTNRELVDLDAMLVQVSEVEGQPTSSQLSVLQSYRNVTGITA